jgi:hypothetical protein
MSLPGSFAKGDNIIGGEGETEEEDHGQRTKGDRRNSMKKRYE